VRTAETEWPTAWRTLAQLLRWPGNLGINLYVLPLESTVPAQVLLVWIDGVASDEKLKSGIVEPLLHYRGIARVKEIGRALSVPAQKRTKCLAEVAASVMHGATAVLLDGPHEALLVDTLELGSVPGPSPQLVSLGPELRRNLGFIRRRINDLHLLAFNLDLKQADGIRCAMVYMEGKTPPALVRQVRRWAFRHMNRESAQQGRFNGAGPMVGLLPRFDPICVVDRAALLLNQGCILLLVDGVTHALAAPVTAAAWATGPRDRLFVYPLKASLNKIRLLCAFAVLLLPGFLVALLNYHVNMVPAPFLAAFTSTREAAPLSLVFEIFLLEVLADVTRAIAVQVASGLSLGIALVVLCLMLLLAVLSGFFGPLPALAAIIGSLLTLFLPSYGMVFLVRVWRYYVLAAAGSLGFFGIAIAVVIMLAYLGRVRRWGLPFLGAAGVSFKTQKGKSAIHSRRKGGRRAWDVTD